MGETLHAGWNIILLHQVIPHGVGLTDVLPDLHQFAYHLRQSKDGKVACGRAFQESELDQEKTKMYGKVSKHLQRQLRLGEIRAEGGGGVGQNTHWAPRVAYLEIALNTAQFQAAPALPHCYLLHFHIDDAVCTNEKELICHEISAFELCQNEMIFLENKD